MADATPTSDSDPESTQPVQPQPVALGPSRPDGVVVQILDAIRNGQLSGFDVPPSSDRSTEEAIEWGSTISTAICPDCGYIGPYRILEQVGEGGMGTVYRAEQREPVRRVVALKVIKPGMDTKEVVARFGAERQALALMNHPNVAQVFDAGATAKGRPYFAMEYVPGVPLTRYCDENRLTIRERLELFVQVCQAVQHAHQKGIIHRDLKPSNILVMLFDGRPMPKVIDFGIAKATNQALSQHTLCTRSGTLIGTPEYMSPEQAMTSGLDVDTRTDVYSLGVILYELLTGGVPFDLKAAQPPGPEGISRIIRDTEPRRPSTRLQELASATAEGESAATAGAAAAKMSLTQAAQRRRTEPRALLRQVRGDLDVIVLKAIEKDRTRRYETAAALATDVRRHLDDEPVLARPPTAVHLLGRRLRRHRRSLAVGGGALVLVTVAAYVFGLRVIRDKNKAVVLAPVEVPGTTVVVPAQPVNTSGQLTSEQYEPVARVGHGSPPQVHRQIAEHVNRGTGMLAQGRIEPAVEEFSAALRLDPTNADAVHGLGVCYVTAGDRMKGLERLETALLLYGHPAASRSAVHNAAVAYLPVNPMRSVQLIDEYLRVTPAAMGAEPLHDLMWVALSKVDRDSCRTAAWGKSEAFYFEFNKLLEEIASDGRKRWGSQWVQASVADAKWQQFLSRRSNVDRLESEVERTMQLKLDAWRSLNLNSWKSPGSEEVQRLRTEYKRTATKEAELRKQLRAAQAEFDATEKPPMPHDITFLPIRDWPRPSTNGADLPQRFNK